MSGFSSSQITRSRKKTIRISDLDRKIADLRYKVSAFRFLTLLRKFDPDQPRDDQGRWTDGAGSTATSNPLDAFAAMRGNEAECEAQYKLDSIICRIVANRTCWQQAAARRAACVSGYPLPPLNW